MKIKIREKGRIYVLDLEGNIDINASNFVETVGWVLTHRSKEILCNFADVNIVDYLGISLIAVAYKNVLNHKGKMKFYNVPSHIRKLFSVVGMERILDVYETEEQALSSFKEDKIFAQILKDRLRRRFKRVPLRCGIEFRQKFSSSDTFYEGKILNMSGIGLFVMAEKTFSIGDILFTRLNLMPSPGMIEIDTKVVWLPDKEIQPHESPGMGLEFHDIDPKKQEKIIEFIEKHLTHSAKE